MITAEFDVAARLAKRSAAGFTSEHVKDYSHATRFFGLHDLDEVLFDNTFGSSPPELVESALGAGHNALKQDGIVVVRQTIEPMKFQSIERTIGSTGLQLLDTYHPTAARRKIWDALEASYSRSKDEYVQPNAFYKFLGKVSA